MRILFLLLFFSCILSSKAWAQPRTYPLAWGTSELSTARTEATTAVPYTTTLKIPYFYDFTSRYIHLDSIKKGTPVTVYTLRPHGLVSKDTVEISGALDPTTIADFTGKKIAKVISDYEFQLFKDTAFAIANALSSSIKIDYLRISKLGARETIKPDTLAFYDNHSGVQINGGSAKNQPSYYVASFDGLNENGTPYSSNTLAVGYTDSLRSHPFNFSGYTAASSIYMSFFYQHGGNGEAPDANDHLYLEFLDATQQWNIVKDLNGTDGGAAEVFHAVMVPINDNKYFHNNFQYRFRSYGRQSGSYDVWNIDYIYIKKYRTAADSLLYDFSIQNADQTFLKKYSAMPFNHFFAYTDTTQINVHLKSFVTNQKLIGKSKGMEAIVKDQFNNQIGYRVTVNDQDQLKLKTYIDTLPLPLTFPTRNKPMYVDITYRLADDQTTDLTTDTVELMFNNALTKRTYLYDYYAYDDSEAESAFGTNFSGTQIACEFKSEIKDALTHIDICFARSKGPNMEGSQIYLMVWKNALTDANNIYKKVIAIHYQNFANGFSRYELASPIILDSLSKYYIGYQQNFPSLLTLGYDRNKDSRKKMYYKESNAWIQMSTDPNIDSGSVM
ncbi:MAG: hypothetical protein H7282_13145, partial [Cytophagaceae bacterium]|nr:hypothetical protein [Cytophagaceae bacterium]